MNKRPDSNDDPESILERLGRAEPLPPEPEPKPNGAANDIAPLEFFDVGAWQGQPVPPQEWAVYKRIPHEQVTLLGGDGATGKTTIGLQLDIATILGRDWLGAAIEKPGRSMFFTAEESLKELHRRLADVLLHYEADYYDIRHDFFPHCRPDADAILGMPDRNGIIRPTRTFLELQAAVLDIRPRVVVIEAASDVFGGDENNRPQVRGFLGMLRGQLAMKCETAVVLLQHPSLMGLATGSGTSGSTQWNNSARSRLYLSTVKTNGEAEPDNNLRKLEVMKANFGPKGEVVKLRWEAGVFIVVEGERAFEKLARAKRADGHLFQIAPALHEPETASRTQRRAKLRARAVRPAPGGRRHYERRVCRRATAPTRRRGDPHCEARTRVTELCIFGTRPAAAARAQSARAQERRNRRVARRGRRAGEGRGAREAHTRLSNGVRSRFEGRKMMNFGEPEKGVFERKSPIPLLRSNRASIGPCSNGMWSWGWRAVRRPFEGRSKAVRRGRNGR